MGLSKPPRRALLSDDNEAVGLHRRPLLSEMNSEQLREVQLAATFGRVPRWFVIEVAGMGK